MTLGVPFILQPGEARAYPGCSPTVKVAAADSASAVSVFENSLEPWASGPVLHTHSREDEGLYVVQGRLLLQLGDDRFELGAGCFAWLPRNVPHAFANAAAETVKIIGFATPGGIEEAFAEQTEYFNKLQGPPNLGHLQAIFARYGGSLLGPPIRAVGAPPQARITR